MIGFLENMAREWHLMSGDAVAVNVDEFLRFVLGGRLEDFLEWIDAGHALAVANDVARARQNPVNNAVLPGWVYHNLNANLAEAMVAEAGGALVLGEDAGVVAAAGAALGGLGCPAEECVEGVRKPKKQKKNALFSEGVAEELVARGVAEAGALAARERPDGEAGRG